MIDTTLSSPTYFILKHYGRNGEDLINTCHGTLEQALHYAKKRYGNVVWSRTEKGNLMSDKVDGLIVSATTSRKTVHGWLALHTNKQNPHRHRAICKRWNLPHKTSWEKILDAMGTEEPLLHEMKLAELRKGNE